MINLLLSHDSAKPLEERVGYKGEEVKEYTDTVYLENFRDSLFSLYLHKYSHFTREISF